MTAKVYDLVAYRNKRAEIAAARAVKPQWVTSRPYYSTISTAVFKKQSSFFLKE